MFDIVRTIGLAMPRVTESTKYDGSPVLKEDRERMLEEAPDSYYLTAYYRRHPVVLVRLRRVSPDALPGLLQASWRMAVRRHRAPERAQQ